MPAIFGRRRPAVAALAFAFQHHGNIGVTFRVMGVPGTAAEHNALNQGIFAFEAAHKGADRAFRLRVQSRFGG
jgi:hypothetical protein